MSGDNRSSIWSAGSYAVPPAGATWLADAKVSPGPLPTNAGALSDPFARLHAQVRGGLAGEVLHPHPEIVDYIRQASGGDAERLAKSYNEWVAEFAASAPDRFVGVGLVPVYGLSSAMLALEQCQQLGLPSVALDEPPGGHDAPPADADEFWELAAGRTVVSVGRGFGGESTEPHRAVAAGRAPRVAGFLTRLAMSGVIDDHPALRLLLVNHEAGWLPYVLEGSDTNYMRTAASRPRSLGDPDALPSEYVRRITWTTFTEDRFAVVHRRFLGESHLLYSASFPSIASNWPNDVESASRVCQGVDAGAQARLLNGNCQRLFGVGSSESFSQEELVDFQQPVVA